MSQHDYVIANQTFPNFRTDLNSAFAASVSQNSGASAPSTTYAYQLWYDTGNDILKMRNADNDAWIDLFTVDQTADTASAPSVAAGSNLIINGNMAVWQRGVAIDTITSGSYLCDRWRISHAGTDGNVDVDQDTSVPTGKGFSFSQKISMDASETSLDAADQVNVHQRFEAQNIRNSGWDYTSASSYLTLSFWVRSSVASTYSVEFGTIDGTSKMIGKTYVINSADSWEYKKVTISGDAGLTIDNDNGQGFDLRFWIDAGSDWTSGTFATSWENTTSANRVSQTTGWLESTSPEFYLTGVQLEVGTVANPVFQHESFAETLQKCQRYYQQSYALGTVAGTATTVGREIIQASGTVLSTTTRFTTEMRATPTVTCFGPTTGATGIDISGSNSITFTLADQSPTSFRVGKGTTPSFLSYQFRAVAEL